MSIVKITNLPALTTIAANTSNTLFLGVDLATSTTGKFTATTLAQQLYSNNSLLVGNSQILLPNTTGQFVSSGNSYVQLNMVNSNDNGTFDIVVTANTGTDSIYFFDAGLANKNYEAGSAFNNIGNAVKPLDGYVYVQGNTGTTSGGNLIVGTTTANTALKFIVGGGSAANIVAYMSSNSLVLNTQSYITFADGTKQTTAGATNAYSIAAFAQANSAAANTVVSQGVNSTQNTNIQSAWTQANSANVLAQSAFNKANNALANTTGTFAGDLTLTGNVIAASIQSTSGPITTGNLIVNGTTTSNGTANITGTLNVSGVVSMNAQVVITNTSFSSTQAAVTIAASNTVATPSQDGYMIHISGKQNVSSRIVSDSYGANTYVVYAGRSARGNITNPSAVQTNDVLSRFSGNGYGTTKYQPLGTARIDFVAAENYTDTTTGSQIQFWNCSVGTNTVTKIASFNGSSVTFTGTVEPQKGFVYTPTVFAGAQTAITIDMSNNSVVRAQTSSGLTVTLSNLLSGKEVIAWITNTAGSTQSFTHGVSAVNSTTGSTSYNIPGSSTILARYMSIDGTTQNTFVAITHA